MKIAFIALLILCLGYQSITSFTFNQYLKNQDNVYWMGYGPPFSQRVLEITKFIRQGRLDSENIHQQVSRNGQRFKYDFAATKYIVENLKVISPENKR